MPQIRPFRGILYNPDKIPDLKEVITPPYDVISEKEQDEYYRQHPRNMIRLVLNKIDAQDTEQDNRYTRAAECFRSWLDTGVLQRDLKPAFYVTEIDFEVDGEVRTRFGFIALARLESFESGAILRHEKTFSNVKEDRLKLMNQCKANFSPIFSLFPDPDHQIVEKLREAIQKTAPDLDFTDLRDYHHRLWRVTDAGVHEDVGRQLAGRLLYLADGHHRYETALRYRDLLMSRGAGLSSEAPCRFVMMSLSSMQDPGLVIRPVHRVICGLKKQVLKSFVDSARAYFEIEALTFGDTNRKEAEEAFLARVKAGAGHRVIGVAMHDSRTFHILRVKDKAAGEVLGDGIPGPLKKLDVTLVTKLILEGILNLNGPDLDDERRILYTSRADKALKAVHAGECPIALILNPTTLEQIREVSEAGLIMPRKSTYFYPKVMTGLVINKINED